MYTAKMALHENCTGIIDIFEGFKDWFIVMEHCETDILSWLIENNYHLPEKVCRFMI